MHKNAADSHVHIGPSQLHDRGTHGIAAGKFSIQIWMTPTKLTDLKSSHWRIRSFIQINKANVLLEGYSMSLAQCSPAFGRLFRPTNYVLETSDDKP